MAKKPLKPSTDKPEDLPPETPPADPDESGGDGDKPTDPPPPPKKKSAAKREAEIDAAARQYTVDQWARGRYDAITKAFVSDHTRVRTVKRSAKAWMALYKKWLKEPR